MGRPLYYDVWHTAYYIGVTYAGDSEMPELRGTDEVPDREVLFSDSCSRHRDDSGAWVVPYEHDVRLERLWNNAFRYMDGLLAHPGIVSWDFSMYRNMPISLQQWNCFRGRLLGSLYERMGGTCIPNLRPTDRRGWEFSFDGLPSGGTFSMGSAGNLRDPKDRLLFRLYVAEAVRRLHPGTIAVYGDAPEDVFSPALEAGVRVVSFPSRIRRAHGGARS